MKKVICEQCEAELTMICNGQFAVCFDEDFIYNVSTDSGELVLKDGVLVDDFITPAQSIINENQKYQAA